MGKVERRIHERVRRSESTWSSWGVPGSESFSPFFRSDGLIAFVASHAFVLNSEIIVMNPDGTGQVNLSNHAADESSPGFAGPVTMLFMP